MSEPSFSTTYKRADGELIGNDYGWVTELDHFDYDLFEPVELIAERWERVSVEKFWHMPDSLFSCSKVADCDNDSVAWEQQSDSRWVETCAEHAASPLKASE